MPCYYSREKAKTLFERHCAKNYIVAGVSKIKRYQSSMMSADVDGDV